MKKTSLSAGELIGEMLARDERVTSRANRLWPVVADQEAIKPYIVFRRSSFEQQPQKMGLGADSVNIEVQCYADTHEESIELAEAVRAALDHQEGKYEYTDDETDLAEVLTLRSCTLVNSSETWENDAYAQGLLFNVKI